MPQEKEAEPKRNASRRQVIVAGGAAVAVVGAGGALAVARDTSADASAIAAQNTGSESAEVCYRLSSQAMEGPYYIDADKIRTDITEDREGIPLTLSIKVIDSVTCRPVRGAAVDIWHCDALGLYSGYEDSSSPPPGGAPSATPTATPTGDPGEHQEPTDDRRYLRGTLRTGHDGRVRFVTVFPGWYPSRAVHIHAKVHVDGVWTKGGYEGGRTCHTGQLYFEEEAVRASAEVEPYSANDTPRVTLAEDTIYDQTGTTGGLLTLKYHKRNISKGVSASITVGVDPDAVDDGDDG
ncbi:intradiol ring-cleavage dioxygenase [Streptomyces sp. CRN 30]|uniref:intradiol ring-cleavage dioxygenase n=1 Tax=Streptomyces sp. CRN 30 TaxID=3075613 RepID=UPI002A8368BA|nr:intradiol ring-cleavage dioxygenase [Streptomyces sp. CRN 30]